MERTKIEQLIEKIENLKEEVNILEDIAYGILVQKDFDDGLFDEISVEEPVESVMKMTKRKTPHYGRREWETSEEDVARAYYRSKDEDYKDGKKPTVTEFARFIKRNPKSVFTKIAQFRREESCAK